MHEIIPTHFFHISIIVLLGLFQISVQATTIKGYVTEKNSNEPLLGAVVYLEGTNFSASVNLDGSYEIKNVQKGDYKLICKNIGYKSFEKNITLGTEPLYSLNIILEEDPKMIGEIVITSLANRESEASARKSEQNSNTVMNILSAKTIQLLPDVTVGNVLQRVSGVSIIRNSSGDGEYAIIRGMDKRYNYLTVNGIKIPSPDPKNRHVPLDIFPSELLERLEVIKALTPNIYGDAIGGAMNLVMKSAPNQLTFNATVSTGFSDLYSKDRPFSSFSTDGLQMTSLPELNGHDYIAKPIDFSTKHLSYTDNSFPINAFAGVSIGNRILNNKLGFIVAGSYSRVYRGGNSLFYVPSGQPSPDPANSPVFDAVQDRKYSNLQTRLGSHIKLDYDFNQNNKISWYNMFVQLEENQHREMLGNTLTGFGDVNILNRSRYTKQNIYNTTLNGEHLISDLKINWSLACSRATNQVPDWVDWTVKYVVTPDINGNKITSTQYIHPLTHIWTHNEDNDKSACLNLNYSLLPNLELGAGGSYITKDRSNFYTSYTLNTILAGTEPQAYTSIDRAVFNFLPASDAIADTTNGNNYTANEDITTGYAQLKYSLNKFQIYGGIRFENTTFKYYSQIPPTSPGKSGTITYLDVLPSVHLKYSLSEKQNLRLSYFSGISRPDFYEYIPNVISGDYFNEGGNYNLKHTQSNNLDFRYELFPRGNEQILAGVFYKYLIDPIEYGFRQISNSGYIYTPLNVGNATNYGFEFVITKFIKNFGITANYTYTKSSITTTKRVYGRDAANNIVNTIENQTRPLQGQSDHIANVSFIYKNAKSGIDAQIAWVYTGKRINIVSAYKDLDYWQQPTSQIDFSANKRFAGHYSVFLKATNILNNPIVVQILKPNNLASLKLPEQTVPNSLLVQRDLFGRTFSLGLRYKL